ncbi:A24 family peptidase [Microbacterium sp. NPDC096154]|uniref:A24 family peptidase n=1 Tax=Microbacterium sp. NPDC096154 TaxID=3155549 RepID=UPI003318E4A3
MCDARPRLRDELVKLSGWHAVAAALAAAWAVWASGPSWLAPAYVLAAVAAVPLAAIDVAERRLPDVLTIPLIPATAVLLLLPRDLDAWVGALLGAAALGGAFLALHVAHPAGLGFGDVKLAVTLGLLAGWHGWPAVFATGAAPFACALPASLALMVTKRARHLALGPYLLGGAIIVLTAARFLA